MTWSGWGKGEVRSEERGGEDRAYDAGMSSRHRPVRLTFPQTHVREPVVYHLGVDYGVVTSIRRASIEDHFGWMVLDMTGDPDQLDAAEAYLRSLGIEVDPAMGDIVEG